MISLRFKNDGFFLKFLIVKYFSGDFSFKWCLNCVVYLLQLCGALKRTSRYTETLYLKNRILDPRHVLTVKQLNLTYKYSIPLYTAWACHARK